MNFMANQIFGEIKVTENEYTGSSSYSFNWGGDNPLGEGKTRNFYRRIAKRPVCKLVFLLIRAASSISKTGVVFGELKKVYTQNKFHFLLNNYFCLPLPSPPNPQPHFFPNQPPGLPEYSLKTNLSTFEN